MHYVTVTFTAVSGSIPRQDVSGYGLAGLLFNGLFKWAGLSRGLQEEGDWLHAQNPKPFSMRPLFSHDQLSGVRYGVMSTRAALLLERSWDIAIKKGLTLSLGKQHQLVPTALNGVQGRGFAQMMRNSGSDKMRLRFLTPTTFAQGQNAQKKQQFLLMPIPRNVFMRPLDMWQAFAPPTKRLNVEQVAAWEAWLGDNIWVSRHHIQTDLFATKRGPVSVGFTGRVELTAFAEDEFYRQFWQALGQFAAYSGVGAHTAMGLGCVDYISGER